MVGTLGVFIVPLSMFDPLLISSEHSDSRIYGSFPRGDSGQVEEAEHNVAEHRIKVATMF